MLKSVIRSDKSKKLKKSYPWIPLFYPIEEISKIQNFHTIQSDLKSANLYITQWFKIVFRLIKLFTENTKLDKMPSVNGWGREGIKALIDDDYEIKIPGTTKHNIYFPGKQTDAKRIYEEQ